MTLGRSWNTLVWLQGPLIHHLIAILKHPHWKVSEWMWLSLQLHYVCLCLMIYSHVQYCRLNAGSTNGGDSLKETAMEERDFKVNTHSGYWLHLVINANSQSYGCSRIPAGPTGSITVQWTTGMAGPHNLSYFECGMIDLAMCRSSSISTSRPAGIFTHYRISTIQKVVKNPVNGISVDKNYMLEERLEEHSRIQSLTWVERHL